VWEECPSVLGEIGEIGEISRRWGEDLPVIGETGEIGEFQEGGARTFQYLVNSMKFVEACFGRMSSALKAHMLHTDPGSDQSSYISCSVSSCGSDS
jgi:hypothetical protein